MTTISLRAYHREIESLIDSGRLKEAIAHCHHILKTFPKSIDTYRLLGRAFLEARRYTEGADVLQRVLSAIPDDFVSHVGMSMIREDEGNLDAAIWHMERAFEAQPSNVPVQDELRRLHGRRDGVQPAKIRLTRGALVRMYARGGLYQQAIAEARMALVEQPDRLDLEILLARMYFLSNQKTSASEICLQILEKLPYCYEANKILVDVLTGTDRSGELTIYQERLMSLDPYMAHLPPDAASSAEAPDDSVTLDLLEVKEVVEGEEQPEWAQNIGVRLEEEEEKLPDWMLALGKSEEPVEDITQFKQETTAEIGTEGETSLETEETGPVPVPDDQIPDWMKAAGWQAAEGTTEEPGETPEITEQPADEIEIPDWLQSIAPMEEEAAIFATEEPVENEEDTQWLESILTGGAPTDLPATEGDIPTPDEAEEIQATGELSFLEEAISKEAAAEEESESWRVPTEELSKEEIDHKAIENVAEIFESPEAQQDIPDWLAGLAELKSEEEPTEPAEELSENLDWLKALAEEKEKPSEFELEGSIEFKEGIPQEEVTEESATAIPFTEEELEIIRDLASVDESGEEEAEVTAEFLTEMEKTQPAEWEATEPVRAAPSAEEIPEPEMDLFKSLFKEPGESPFETPEIPGHEADLEEELTLDESAFTHDELENFLPESLETADFTTVPELEIPDWLKESLDRDIEDLQVKAEMEAAEYEPQSEEIAPFEELEEEEIGEEEESLAQPVESAEAAVGQPEGTVMPFEESESLHGFLGVETPIDQAQVSNEEIREETNEKAPFTAFEEDLTLPDWLAEDLVGEEEVETAGEAGEAEFLSMEGLVSAAEEEESILESEEIEIIAKEEIVEEVEPTQELKAAQEVPPLGAETAEIGEYDFFEEPGEIELKEEAEALETTAEGEYVPEEVEAPETGEPSEREEVPDWLMALAEDIETPPAVEETEEIVPPAWLKELEEEPEALESAEEGQEQIPAVQEWVAETVTSEAQAEEAPSIHIPTPAGIATDESSELYNAQAALNAQAVEKALYHYNNLINQGEALDEIIHDLREALYHYPLEISLWQTLGDAYLRSNQLQEALEAYTKAEELLR